jgi:hypothetical protein
MCSEYNYDDIECRRIGRNTTNDDKPSIQQQLELHITIRIQSVVGTSHTSVCGVTEPLYGRIVRSVRTGSFYETKGSVNTVI